MKVEKNDYAQEFENTEAGKEAYTAVFMVAGANIPAHYTYCNLQNRQRYFKCPLELSLAQSKNIDYTVAYPLSVPNSTAAQQRIVTISGHGATSMMDSVRAACARCQYNKLKVSER